MSGMAVHKRGEGIFDVESESSSRSYIVSWGTEGDFFSCTCTAYAIGRNRAGGLGFPFDCKHVRAVKQDGPMAEEFDRQRKVAEAAAVAQKEEKRKVAASASLLDLERKLRG